jgi:hypothetical protein
VPLLAGMFLEINALVIATMIVAFLVHDATALWDVNPPPRRAQSRRRNNKCTAFSK